MIFGGATIISLRRLFIIGEVASMTLSSTFKGDGLDRGHAARMILTIMLPVMLNFRTIMMVMAGLTYGCSKFYYSLYHVITSLSYPALIVLYSFIVVISVAFLSSFRFVLVVIQIVSLVSLSLYGNFDGAALGHSS